MRKALGHQRVMLFVAANEAGGSALLYRILRKTKHPLFIYYITRYKGEGDVAANFLKRDPAFKKAMVDSGSDLHSVSLNLYQSITGGENFVQTMLSNYESTHGKTPISYILHNGQPGFGEHADGNEHPDKRAARLARNWAPWEGALKGVPTRDNDNPFNFVIPFLAMKTYVSSMYRICQSALPLVRTDGEGSVLLKTPCKGDISSVRSKTLRESLVHPTHDSFKRNLQALREHIEDEMSRAVPKETGWPKRGDFLQLGDIFAKSAITLHRDFCNQRKIAFNRIAHNPWKLDQTVSLLLESELVAKHATFTQDELEKASEVLEGDNENSVSPKPKELFRKIVSNTGRATKASRRAGL